MRFLVFRDGCQHSPALKKRGKNGYTLIELILVVITVGVLAAISLPRFGGGSILYKHKIDAAINRLAVDLRYTRQLAITTSTNHQLIIDIPARNYAIYKEPVSAVNQVEETRFIDKNIGIEGNSIFIFEPKGNASVTSGTTCTFSEGGYPHTLSIISATGRIKW